MLGIVQMSVWPWPFQVLASMGIGLAILRAAHNRAHV